MNGHQTHSHPALKPIPREVIAGRTAKQRKVMKRQHNRRARRQRREMEN